MKKHILEFKKTEQIGNEDPKFVLLTTDAEIKNKFDVSYEKTKEEFCVVTTPTLATRIIKIIRARIKTLARRGVETRLIIENPSNNFEKENNLIKRLIPQDAGHFVAKRLSDGGSLLPYRIFDNNEVWIMITKETETGQPSFLWTNAPNIVQFYKRSFDLAWNSPNAVTFRVSRSRSKASASKPRVKVKQE